jgi:hypothetical protein
MVAEFSIWIPVFFIALFMDLIDGKQSKYLLFLAFISTLRHLYGMMVHNYNLIQTNKALKKLPKEPIFTFETRKEKEPIDFFPIEFIEVVPGLYFYRITNIGLGLDITFSDYSRASSFQLKLAKEEKSVLVSILDPVNMAEYFNNFNAEYDRIKAEQKAKEIEYQKIRAKEKVEFDEMLKRQEELLHKKDDSNEILLDEIGQLSKETEALLESGYQHLGYLKSKYNITDGQLEENMKKVEEIGTDAIIAESINLVASHDALTSAIHHLHSD